MILPDTSIWIDHLNRGDPRLAALLDDKLVVMHPFVVGEIALGTMPDWDRIMFRLERLPPARKATDLSVIELIRARSLGGSGIGYVDAHLLGSCLIADDTWLWTRDKRLARTAELLGLAAKLHH